MGAIRATRATRAIGSGDGRFHFRSTMARHHHGRASLELSSGIQHMLQQGATSQLLQHLGMAAFHAGAFAGSHDDDVQRCSHIDLWDENRLIIDP